MNSYELILIFDPALGEDKIAAMVGKVEDKIKSLKGEITKTEKWGLRRLASMMKKAKKVTQAYYVLVRFDSPPGVPAELKAYLKVTENVIRYFVSKAVELPPAPERTEAKPLEAVNVGEIKSSEEAAEVGKP